MTGNKQTKKKVQKLKCKEKFKQIYYIIYNIIECNIIIHIIAYITLTCPFNFIVKWDYGAEISIYPSLKQTT